MSFKEIEYNGQQLEQQALNKLKDSLLQMNGALLQCGVDKDTVEIMLPREDFIYMKTVLSYETSAYHKFFHLTDNVNEFTLCGMKIKSFGV